MDRGTLIAKMRGRVEMCRRLARSTMDPNTARTLRQMADEGEADIDRLLSEDLQDGAEPPAPSAEPDPI